jgi:hypothetical protein
MSKYFKNMQKKLQEKELAERTKKLEEQAEEMEELDYRPQKKNLFAAFGGGDTTSSEDEPEPIEVPKEEGKAFWCYFEIWGFC